MQRAGLENPGDGLPTIAMGIAPAVATASLPLSGNRNVPLELFGGILSDVNIPQPGNPSPDGNHRWLDVTVPLT